MNNMLLVRAEKWLNELGFKTEGASTALKVSRDSIENFPTDADSLLGELRGNSVPACAGVPKMTTGCIWRAIDIW